MSQQPTTATSHINSLGGGGGGAAFARFFLALFPDLCLESPRGILRRMLFDNSVSLGLAALGRPGYINLGREDDLPSAAARTKQQMQDLAFSVLDAFHAQGGRHVDAARSYGVAEEFLSKWLRSRGAEVEGVMVCSSKWGYRYTGDWAVTMEDSNGQPHEVKEHTASHLRSQSVESLALLPKLALYQIHSATPDSGAFSDEVLEELRDLKKRAGCRIGLSTTGPDQATTIDLAIKHRDLFSCVQTTYNPLAQASGAALQRAQEAGLDIIVKEGMANGRLWHTPPPTLRNTAASMGVALDALVLGLVLAAPFRPQVLSGAVSVEQLQSNMDALPVRDHFLQHPDEWATLMDSCRQEEAAYWKDRSGLAWH